MILPSSSATTAVGPLLSSSPFNANSTFLMPLAQLSTNTFSNPLPVLFQPFVLDPGFSPVRAKVVSEIVSGNLVDLGNLLQANIAEA